LTRLGDPRRWRFGWKSGFKVIYPSIVTHKEDSAMRSGDWGLTKSLGRDLIPGPLPVWILFTKAVLYQAELPRRKWAETNM
jgi:hypothetical protein